MEDENSIEKKVFGAIERGEAKMHSRWYFALRAALAAATGILLLALLIYCASLVIFALHENGAWFARDFGFSGWYLFFRSLPVILILLTLVFTLTIAMLAQRYAFVYHRPLVYSLLIIAGLTTVISFLIAPTAFHRVIVNYATANHLPFLGTFYEFEEIAPSAVHRGQVAAFAGRGFILMDLDGETTTVVITPTTSFMIGDTVVVFGDINTSNTIQPFGVEKIIP